MEVLRSTEQHTGSFVYWAKALGAKEAYVISDLPFYEKLGFEKAQQYSFYWKE